MLKEKTLQLGLNVHLEAHANKIILILDGKPHIIKVDDPYYLDLLMLSLAKAKLETKRFSKNTTTKRQPSGAKICLNYQMFGLRKNCTQVFYPNRTDKMHCSDGCRDTYNAKKRKMKNQSLRVSKRVCLFFVTYGERTNCQKNFIPKRSDASFCSAACRDHYNKKEYRNKKKAPKNGGS